MGMQGHTEELFFVLVLVHAPPFFCGISVDVFVIVCATILQMR